MYVGGGDGFASRKVFTKSVICFACKVKRQRWVEESKSSEARQDFSKVGETDKSDISLLRW